MKWAEFGLQASIQGKCCGPYKTTYGAKYGLGSRRCGLYMSSEIQAVTDMLYYYDKDTQSAIGYLKENSKDGWTEGGTWFSYTDRNSIQAIVQFLSKSIKCCCMRVLMPGLIPPPSLIWNPVKIKLITSHLKTLD